MKATTTCVIITRTGLALAALLGTAAACAETAGLIVTDVFGEYQLYRYLHPWRSGARARNLDAAAPVPPALPCRTYGFLEVTTEGYRRVGGFRSADVRRRAEERSLRSYR